MRRNLTDVINNFICTQTDEFTIEEASEFLKENGFRIKYDQIETMLFESDMVYNLDNYRYITYTAAYEGAIFSFKPTVEEIEKGHIIIGGRGQPYICPLITPDLITVCSEGKKIKSEVTEFSMNFLLDKYVLFGEGYDLLTIMNDKANDRKRSNDPTNLPAKVKQTSWPLSKIKGGKDIQFGDRIICKLVDWKTNTIDVYVQKEANDNLVISDSLIQQQEWYADFESEMLNEINTLGPMDSIFSQVTYVIMSARKKLSYTENCGAMDDFLEYTKKLGFKPYGVENRIWLKNEEIPFCGNWNGNTGIPELERRLNSVWENYILESLVKNEVYEEKNHKNLHASSLVWDKVLPRVFETKHFPTELRENVFLNIEKRRDIIAKKSNSFEDYSFGEVRMRTVNIYSQVLVLLGDLIYTAEDVKGYPSQELIMLCQLCIHLERILEEIDGNDFTQLNGDDINPTLDGMEDTFEEIEASIRAKLDRNNRASFKLYSDV